MIFPAERQRLILACVDDSGSVRVVDLARRFDVAEETIRRDLEKLDSAGKLVRTHGGAVAVDDSRQETPFEDRATTHSRAKRAIAAEAARVIEPGDVIALDASSTCLELARVLPAGPLTVVTCSPGVPLLLAEREDLTVICTGGQLDPGPRCYVGWIAEHALTRLNIQKAFISCRGLDAERGLSEATESHARLKRKLIELADATHLLADASKLGVRSSFFYAGVPDLAGVITDAADADAEALREAGVNVTTVRA